MERAFVDKLTPYPRGFPVANGGRSSIPLSYLLLVRIVEQEGCPWGTHVKPLCTTLQIPTSKHRTEPRQSTREVIEVMAGMATLTLSGPVAGLGGSALLVRTTRSKMQLTSAFVQRTSMVATPKSDLCMSRVTCFERDWLRKDLSVIGFGLIGWIAPSSIPCINGNSLTGLFLGSIGPELAHWPTGPALTSPFWLWMITWHLGLFICLTFGQIGFKGRKDGYFNKE